MHTDFGTTDIDKNIGRQIREKRMERRVSLSVLAREIGVSVGVLQEFEAGTARVGALALWLASGFLCVPVTSFFHATQHDPLFDRQNGTTGWVVGRRRHTKCKLVLIKTGNDPADKTPPPS
jgi:transcriptional regulator with XRE-family HTH domain